MGLQEKLERIAGEMPGTFGVAVKHLETGEEASLLADERFQLASVFKIPILATLYRDVEEGRLSLATRVTLQAEERVPGSGVLQELDPGAEVSLKDLAMLMIIVSDNYGTDQVLKYVGIERVNRFMQELGLNKTHIQHDCWRLLTICTGLDVPAPTAEGYDEYMRREDAEQFDEAHPILRPLPENNVSTPHEINRLLEMIARKQLISEAACDGMLNILKRQQFTSRIPNLLPGQARAAHKTGTIGSCVNDAGIVYMPHGKGAFAITVLSRDNETTNQGAQTIARLSRAAYGHFMATE